MSGLPALIRVNLLTFVGSLQKKKKGRYIGAAFAIFIFVVLFGGSMSFQAVASAYTLVVMLNLPRYAVFIGLTSALAISMLFGLMRATTSTTPKDAELLLSLPVKKSSIVLSKLVTQYIFDAPILVIMLLPTVIAIFAFGGLSVFGLLRGILLVIIVPLLSLTVSLMFGYLFSFIRERLPAGNIILIGLTMVILIGYMVLNFQINTVYMQVAQSGPEKAMLLIEKFWPLKAMTNFITDGGWIHTIGTLAVIFAPFAIAVVLYATRFGRGSYHRKSKNRLLSFKVRSLRGTLLIVELKKYFSSTLYVFNTAFGTIMMIAATIAVLVIGPSKIMSFFQADADFPVNINLEQIAGILTLMLCFFGAMTITTPATISFEGKKFWILRSLPIRTGDILAAKLALSIFIFVPAQILCSLVIAIRFGLNAQNTFIMMLLPALLNLAVSGAGLLVNLLLPKLEWRNEAEIVKQSMSVMLSVLLGFALASMPLFLYLAFFMSVGSITAAAYASMGFFLVIFIAEILLLSSPGKKMFERLNA